MRLYLNIRSGNTLIRDPDGEEFTSLKEARQEAACSARELIAEDLKSGRPFNDRSFEISDITGNVISTLTFSDALPRD
ncbi:DUF6894 family protein [Aureimonas ureilytica]|uniref:DUF6894 family protein n=1 Tax=Aureimonas ureilytica TaxID=401562 RepID=UPI003CED6AEE